MKTIKLVLLLLLVLGLMILVFQNQAPIEVRFLWMRGTVPAILLLFLTAASGFVLGLLAPLFVARRRSSRSPGPPNSEKQDTDQASAKE